MAVTEYTERTTAELVALIEADELHVDADCWLLDTSNTPTLDLTDDLVVDGSFVELNIFRRIHRTCQVTLSRELVWGNARIQPALLLSTDGTDWTRFPLGVFLTTTPERSNPESDLQMWTVAGYDLLEVLATPLAASYTIESGALILSAAEALITATGGTTQFDQTAAATTAAATTTYSFLDEEWTTLTVVNALLAQVGYTACWVDRFGNYRAEPYRPPADRPITWTFDTSSTTTTVAVDRAAEADYWQAANQIVGVNTSPELTVPVDGAGIYRLTNPADGPTSIAARGRTLTRILKGQYANQAALVTAVERAMDSEKRVTTKVRVAVSPNPLMSHLTVVDYTDNDLVVSGRHSVENWRLPLDGSNMTMELRGV